MANEGLGESIREMQVQTANRRLARGDEQGARRLFRAAAATQLTEHWRSTGWHQPGKAAQPSEPQGRGWHDADRPSKLLP